MEREEGKTGRRRLEVVTDDDERWALGGGMPEPAWIPRNPEVGLVHSAVSWARHPRRAV